MQMERLQGGGFLKDAINVIAVGRPGAGKSHFTCALGHALVELGYPVLFTPTAALVQRLLAAKRDLRLAAIDRVVHHSVVLDLMTVESYRAKAAKRTKSAAAKTAVAA
jgi:hypothetical protein